MIEETDISTHKDFHLSATGDRRVRMSINRKVFYLTPEDSIALGDRLISTGSKIRCDRTTELTYEEIS